MARTHWFGEDVESFDTTLEGAPSLMPTFDRSPFGANRFHDVIARRPIDGGDPLQIGLVSKQYVLVQHASVVHAVAAEEKKAPCEDGYEIAQVLAWVAAQRANVAERLRWRGQIHGLLSRLLLTEQH